MRSQTVSPAPARNALPLAGFDHLYEAQLRAERKSPNTIRNYRDALERFARWSEANHGRPPALADLNVVEARLFLADALGRRKYEDHATLAGTTKETISVTTVHQYTRGLKTFGAWLERERYAPAHPLQNLRLPKNDEKQLQPLTEEEERALLGAYDDNNPVECRLKAIFLLPLDTGMRLGELLGLKLDNPDLDGGFLLVMGKGPRSARCAPRTPAVLPRGARRGRASPHPEARRREPCGGSQQHRGHRRFGRSGLGEERVAASTAGWQC